MYSDRQVTVRKHDLISVSVYKKLEDSVLRATKKIHKRKKQKKSNVASSTSYLLLTPVTLCVEKCEMCTDNSDVNRRDIV